MVFQKKLTFIKELDKNLGSSPQFIQVILGPRQVGKTTTVTLYLKEKYAKKSIYFSADAVFNAHADLVREHWQKAREEKALLVIDEIQKIENWAEIVKKLWDEDQRHQTMIQSVLLGSSSLDIQKGLTESLTGRFQLIQAHHWNYHESNAGYSISFEEYLKFGGYPGSYSLIKNEMEWVKYLKKSIIETVIDKDILNNHTVKSPSLFKQAFELIISYPAQEISYTKLLGQLQDKGNTEVIKYYIRLFEGAFLVKTLEKFSTKAVKTKSSSPKILPLCPAFFYSTLLGEFNVSERGRVLELMVGVQLNRLGFDLYYWREKNHEVDYILKRGKMIWAIEVKSGRKKTGNGLQMFQKQFPSAKSIIINEENYFEFEKNPYMFLKNVSGF